MRWRWWRSSGGAATGEPNEISSSGRGSIAAGGDIRVAVTGDNVTVHVPPTEAPPAAGTADSLAAQRQELYVELVKQGHRQAEATFRLSVFFMAGGALIVLAGGILALVHAGNPNLDYLPLVTSLTGILITSGGGILARHARHTREDAKEMGVQLSEQIQEDHKLERASGFIDRVATQEQKDLLYSLTAMRALGIEPSPEMLVERVLPQQDGARQLDAGTGDSNRPGQG